MTTIYNPSAFEAIQRSISGRTLEGLPEALVSDALSPTLVLDFHTNTILRPDLNMTSNRV